jgi:hypothetical protein
LRRVFCCLAALLSLAAFAQERELRLPDGHVVRYRLIEDARESAGSVALQVLRHLAAAEISEASALSNAPQRREEVLRDYLGRVGAPEFKRVFARFLEPPNRIVAEVALGPRRLVIWQLDTADGHLAAQYFVETAGRFVIDDVPSAERAHLARILRAYRTSR